MGYAPRPYQADAIDESVGYLLDKGTKGKGALVMPTGAGKSIVITKAAEKLGGGLVVFQPNAEILRQNLEKFIACGHEPSVFSASMRRREVGAVTLATIGSVVRHPEMFRDTRYVMIDECHLVNPKKTVNSRGADADGQYKAFLNGIPKARILGLSATPWRLSTNGLGSTLRFITRTRPKVFHDVVSCTQTGPLFNAGYLCPLKYKSIHVPGDSLRINSTGADYTPESVKKQMYEAKFAERLVEGVKRLLAAGRKHIVVFTRFIDESQYLVDQLGDVAAVVSSRTSDKERRQTLDAFKEGRIRVVANVGIIGIGFDFPALDTVVVACYTRSLALWLQWIGRAVRTHPDKDWAAIIDMTGMLKLFGKMEDIRIKPGGKKGDLWTVWNAQRQLTNVYYGKGR